MLQRVMELETEVANGKEAMLKMEHTHASFESQVQFKEVRLRGEFKLRESIASVSTESLFRLERSRLYLLSSIMREVRTSLGEIVVVDY